MRHVSIAVFGSDAFHTNNPMSKRDLKRELRHLYQASAKHAAEVEVPEFCYLMIDGEGDPNGSVAYAQAVEALFSVSYTAKFSLKKAPWRLITPSCPWRGCGGRMIGPCLRPMTEPAGNGR